MFDIIIFVICVSLVFQCIIMNRHKIKWWKGLIPGYNKYLLGKICERKKLGLVNAILSVFTKVLFYACYLYEVWIIKNYAVQVKIPVSDTESTTQIVVQVPKNIADIAIWSKYILLAFIFISLSFWCMMMWTYTIKHQRSRWWILLWVILPVIPFGYFAFINTVYVDGEVFKIKREFKYERT